MNNRGSRKLLFGIGEGIFILVVFWGNSIISDIYGAKYLVKVFSQTAGYLLICPANASEESEGDVETKRKEKAIPESLQPPGTTRPTLPEYRPPKVLPKIVSPPLLPKPKAEELLSAKLRVYVRKISFSANTAIKDDELQKISAPYENRTLTSEDLEELRRKLTMLYVERGYINSGAIIPDQKVVDGVITIQFIEGKLSEIDINGNKWLRSAYIRNRIALGAEVPFNINQLQEKLLLLQEDPLIRSIHSELIPGIKPGEAVLKTTVVEERPYQVGARISNDRHPSIGSLHGEIFAEHRNLSGWGDRLGVRYGKHTDGEDDGGDEVSLSYIIPLNAYNTALRAYYDYSDADVIEEPFDQLDIKSKWKTYGISITHPLLKTLSDEVRLTLAGENRKSDSYLLGQPFSFSEGAENGVFKETVLRFAQEWQYRSQLQVFALRSNISWGIDALNATIIDDGPDGQFLFWMLQVQWARLLENLHRTQLVFRTDLQLSQDPLPAMEKFSVGGLRTVRGYRENQLVRDNAVVSSLECRIPVFRLPIPVVSKKPTDGTVHLVPFFDWGWAENTDRPTPDPRTISSLGLGLRWDPSSNIHADIYWGYALRNIDNPNDDLQDHGFHFQLFINLF